MKYRFHINMYHFFNNIAQFFWRKYMNELESGLKTNGKKSD